MSALPCGKLCNDIIGKWYIEKAYFKDKRAGEFLTSPPFDALNAKWQLKLYVRGGKYENIVFIVLQLLNYADPFLAEVSAAMLYDDTRYPLNPWGQMGSVIVSNDRCPPGTTWEFDQVCSYNDFISRYINRGGKMLILSYKFMPTVITSIPRLADFGYALNDQQYSDVKFLVEDKPIYAHKILLANKSKVFDAMFKHKMKENIFKIVKIEDIEYKVLLALFRFIYSGSLRNIEEIAERLLIAADKYDVIDLKIACGEHLAKRLSVENIREYLDLAKHHHVDSIKLKAVDFIITNPNKVIPTTKLQSIAEAHPDIAVQLIRRLSMSS